MNDIIWEWSLNVELSFDQKNQKVRAGPEGRHRGLHYRKGASFCCFGVFMHFRLLTDSFRTVFVYYRVFSGRRALISF